MRILVLAAAVAFVTTAAGCGSSRPATGSDAGCGSCHGFPPAAPHPAAVAGQWDAADCSGCHSTSVGAGGILVAGGTHADGGISVRVAGHADGYWEPAQHGPDVMSGGALCRSCHGADFTGGPGWPSFAGGAPAISCVDCHTVFGRGDWLTDCTFCHGSPPATGKHVRHVVDLAMGCSACHPGYTSSTVDPALHVDGAADVDGLYDRSTQTCGGCHSAGSRSWN